MNSSRDQKKKKEHTVEFAGLTIRVERRRVKYARVEFKPSGLRLVLSPRLKPLDVLEEMKTTILEKYARLQAQVEASAGLEAINRSQVELERVVERYIDIYSRILNVACREVKYRKMRRIWGNCRSSGVITLNRHLRFVPDKLVAYIVYHELAHLRIRGHNREFKALITKEFPYYRELDKELELFGLKLLA